MWGTRDFSTGEKGEGDFPSCYEGILAVPFKSVQVNQALSQVEGGLGVLLTYGRNCGVPLEFNR